MVAQADELALVFRPGWTPSQIDMPNAVGERTKLATRIKKHRFATMPHNLKLQVTLVASPEFEPTKR